jgi:hypothetical protein
MFLKIALKHNPYCRNQDAVLARLVQHDGHD